MGGKLAEHPGEDDEARNGDEDVAQKEKGTEEQAGLGEDAIPRRGVPVDIARHKRILHRAETRS